MDFLDKHDGFKLHERTNLSEDDGQTAVSWTVGNIQYARQEVEKIMTQFYQDAQI